MAKFLKKFLKLKASPIAQWAKSTGDRAYGDKVGAIQALDAADRAAVDVRNKGLTEQFERETEYRGNLIASQRGGLASTILNLGGSEGDPAKAYASQAVGAEAEGVTPAMEGYAAARALPKRKKAWYDFQPTFGQEQQGGGALLGKGLPIPDVKKKKYY